MEFYESIIEKDYFKLGKEGKGKIKKINKNIIFLSLASILLFILYKVIDLTTDYGRIGDLENYVNLYRRNNSISYFNKMNIGIQIKPSYNVERNIIYLNSFKNVS